MKIPQTPPLFFKLVEGMRDHTKFTNILALRNSPHVSANYLHWDQLRRQKPPAGITSEEWWLAVKMQRLGASKAISLKDKQGKPFQFCLPEPTSSFAHLHGCFVRRVRLLSQYKLLRHLRFSKLAKAFPKNGFLINSNLPNFQANFRTFQCLYFRAASW